jgi:hypothetical protein
MVRNRPTVANHLNVEVRLSCKANALEVTEAMATDYEDFESLTELEFVLRRNRISGRLRREIEEMRVIL